MNDLVAKARLDLDPSGYKRGLEEARKAQLETFAAAKAAVEPANKALAEAQANAQAMARALREDGKAGEAFAGWMKGAADAVRKAKEEVLAKTAALQQARAGVAANASAIEQAAQAEIASIKSAEAARDAAHRRALEATREEIRARRGAAQESAAEAKRAQAAAAQNLSDAWTGRNARVQAEARAAAAVRNADHGPALAEDQRRTQAAQATQKARDMVALTRFRREQDAETMAPGASGKGAGGESTAGEGGGHGSNSGVRSEAIVLAHELAMGNTSRLGGSLMVMAERVNMSGAALMALGVPLALAAAGIYAVTKSAEDNAQSLFAMNRALAASGNMAGLTRVQMGDMAAMVSHATTLTIAEAKELVTSLVASGKIGAEALAPIARVADDLAATLGLDTDKLGAEMVKIFADPAKAALELNARMHNLTVTDQERIATLQRMGDLSGAQRMLADKEKSAVEGQAKQYTPLGKVFQEAKKNWSDFWDHLGEKDVPETAGEKLKAAKARLTEFDKWYPNSGNQRVAKDRARLAAEVAAAEAEAQAEAEAAKKKAAAAEQNRKQSEVAAMVRGSRAYRAVEIDSQLTRLGTESTGDKGMDALKRAGMVEKLAELQHALPNTTQAWQGFVGRVAQGNAQLKLSAAETHEALANLLAGAKTPEQWAGVVAGLTDALAKAGGKTHEPIFLS